MVSWLSYANALEEIETRIHLTLHGHRIEQVQNLSPGIFEKIYQIQDGLSEIRDQTVLDAQVDKFKAAWMKAMDRFDAYCPNKASHDNLPETQAVRFICKKDPEKRMTLHLRGTSKTKFRTIKRLDLTWEEILTVCKLPKTEWLVWQPPRTPRPEAEARTGLGNAQSVSDHDSVEAVLATALAVDEDEVISVVSDEADVEVDLDDCLI